jgi:hypothetical protein
MNERRLHPEHLPPRDATLPYLYTAPIALAVAGALLIHWGPLALTTPWSSPSLAATHVVTLGFLTMVCTGLFTPLLALAGGSPTPWHRATHVVYYALLVGWVGLTVGTARSWAGPVFLSIGAIGVMGVVFLVHGSISLRRARTRGPTVALLRVALWSFFLAASLGIWLAHGHGGMRFPGPRPLWLQVHLSVALLGWIGGSLAAVSAELLPERLTGRIPDARATHGLALPIAIGVTLPVVLVLAQFFGLLSEGDTALPGIAAVTTIPALAAVWLAQPLIAWRALAGAGSTIADARDDHAGSAGALRFIRTGLLLAPLTLVLAVAAFVASQTWLGVLFGWVAIFGWAGGLVQGVLLIAMPHLLSPNAARGASRRDAAWVEVAFVAYAGALVCGALAIAFSFGVFTRLAGVLIILDAIVLLGVIARQRGVVRNAD